MTYDFAKLLQYKTPIELEQYLKISKNKPTNSELYHALAYIAKLPLVKNDKGKISATLSLEQWNLKDLQLCGIMKLFTMSPRGSIFRGAATEEANLRFSALVPLVLSAFKEYNNIPYSAWDWLDPKMKFLFDADFWSLQPYIVNPILVPTISPEDRVAMAVETGKPAKALWSPNVKELTKFPRLLKVQLLQVWVAYPSLRHELMVLDCENLDSIPESIYGDLNVMTEESPFIQYVEPQDTTDTSIPW